MRPPIERLEKKVQKENLWFFILCLLEKRGMYAFEIRTAIKEEFGFLSGNVTAYKVLYLLARGKYVKKINKGNKTYYSITKSGREQLKLARNFFFEMKKL